MEEQRRNEILMQQQQQEQQYYQLQYQQFHHHLQQNHQYQSQNISPSYQYYPETIYTQQLHHQQFLQQQFLQQQFLQQQQQLLLLQQQQQQQEQQHQHPQHPQHQQEQEAEQQTENNASKLLKTFLFSNSPVVAEDGMSKLKQILRVKSLSDDAAVARETSLSISNPSDLEKNVQALKNVLIGQPSSTKFTSANGNTNTTNTIIATSKPTDKKSVPNKAHGIPCESSVVSTIELGGKNIQQKQQQQQMQQKSSQQQLQKKSEKNNSHSTNGKLQTSAKKTQKENTPQSKDNSARSKPSTAASQPANKTMLSQSQDQGKSYAASAFLSSPDPDAMPLPDFADFNESASFFGCSKSTSPKTKTAQTSDTDSSKILKGLLKIGV